MPGDTAIEWTDKSWNPTTGCTQVSPGCAHCYAKTLTERFHGKGSFDTLVLHPDRLDAPLRWKTPRRVFVDSMSDLFHDDVPFEFIYDVFVTMAATPQHSYQVLTKRPERMREFCKRIAYIAVDELEHLTAPGVSFWPNAIDDGIFHPRPLPNVWLGVTVENQRWADERIPILLDTPAAVRFISAEPLLGPVYLGLNLWVRVGRPVYSDLPWRNLSVSGIHRANSNPFGALSVNGLGLKPSEFDRMPRLDWVIVGGESGPRHRPFDPDWARSIVAQCRDAGVKVFIKQMGGNRPGNRMEDLPADLQIREFPDAAN